MKNIQNMHAPITNFSSMIFFLERNKTVFLDKQQNTNANILKSSCWNIVLFPSNFSLLHIPPAEKGYVLSSDLFKTNHSGKNEKEYQNKCANKIGAQSMFKTCP